MANPYKYEAICHTKCYWKETLWDIGEVYQGDEPPNKHFSKDGQPLTAAPPPDAGMDPRPTVELKALLKSYGVRTPQGWSRKQIWAKLVETETAVLKDELTNPTPVAKPTTKATAKKR